MDIWRLHFFIGVRFPSVFCIKSPLIHPLIFKLKPTAVWLHEDSMHIYICKPRKFIMPWIAISVLIRLVTPMATQASRLKKASTLQTWHTAICHLQVTPC